MSETATTPKKQDGRRHNGGAGLHRKYTPEQVELALIAFLAYGNAEQASQHVQREHGFKPGGDLIRYWRDHAHQARYMQLAAEHQDRIAATMAAESEEIARKAARLEHKLLDRLDRESDGLERKDLAGALRNVTTTRSLSIDKVASPLRGRPVIHEHRQTLGEIERRLVAAGVIEGTAQEITAHAEQSEESRAS